MSHSSHHLKAYIVFLVASLLLVGLLAYLYTPFNIDTSYLDSDVLTMSSEEVVSSEVIVTEEVDSDTIEAKRMRLTTLLLRYQKDLLELESHNTLTSPDIGEKIQILRQKIENLQKVIVELAQ